MPKTRTLGCVRIVVLSVLAIFLAWLVITQSFAAYFAYFAPETALLLQPQQPLALVNLADRTLNHPSSQGTSDQTSERREGPSAQPRDSSEKRGGAAAESEKRESAASVSETADQNRSDNPKFAPDHSGTTDELAHAAVLPEATATEVRTRAKAALISRPIECAGSANFRPNRRCR